MLRYASCGKHKNGYHLLKYLNGLTFVMVMLFILCELGTEDFFYDVATAPIGAGHPHCPGFTITLRHTTLGGTPLDE
jgi:hypothetical protein